MKYLALLRGINVGGNNRIKMAELREQLEATGLKNVQTYIQSGNIIFASPETDKLKLAGRVEKAIKDDFGLTVPTVILSHDDLKAVVDELPKKWNSDPTWKYNYLFLKEPYDMTEVVASIGELKPDIEEMIVGKGVLYQSMLLKKFGSTTGGKLAGSPVYKIITIRNHNTVTKLLDLMNS